MANGLTTAVNTLDLAGLELGRTIKTRRGGNGFAKD